MKKKEVNLEFLMQGEKEVVLVLSIVSACLGIGITLNVLLNLINDYNNATLVGLGIVTIFFGVPFGYILGLRNIIYTLRKQSLIRKGEFSIYIDKIVDKRISNITDGSREKYYQIKLKDYSNKTSKYVFLKTLKEFNSVEIGEPCILCFTKLNKKPFAILPGSSYELNSELHSKCVTDLDSIRK